MCCKNFRRFQRSKFKIITNKATKAVKNEFVIWAFMSEFTKILPEMIVNQFIISLS